ncbi:hypothetical protein ABNavy71_050 [Acinetobacter phage AB-Navy71]|nr:hypothetical protein ABNavy71_050 [Acinetobacter phage AB-Navy71]
MKILIEFASNGSQISFEPDDLDFKNLHTNYNDAGKYYSFDRFDFRIKLKDIPADFAERFIDLAYGPMFDSFSKVVLTDNEGNEFEFDYPEIANICAFASKRNVDISLKRTA